MLSGLYTSSIALGSFQELAYLAFTTSLGRNVSFSTSQIRKLRFWEAKGYDLAKAVAEPKCEL